ncbi:DeoR/GlpR family DNA-binding transcription regulator [uncultured Modestobacter sp.]|uniref:DeoR/GlpR family DNA-binding transcription regulator n=1 Tax=uncultured Modestobacter sp. TaxID=380048 RepID=UPI00263882B4|nr:DeoR/GlpR family DNA-binding transcription regulator [uncultured Modestobacter sp.]
MVGSLRGVRLPHATTTRRATRLLALLTLLDESEEAVPADLASALGVSGATVRRDLAELEAQCLVVRTHGRAHRVESSVDVPVALKDTRFREAKRRIAVRAAALIPPGRHGVALNGGSTTAEVARTLAERDGLTIVTNSLTTAVQLSSRPGLRVIVNGGWLRPHSAELVGPLTEGTFAAMEVEFALLGIDGVSAAAGATTHDDTEARANREMILHAQRVVVVADGSKVGRVTSARVADVAEVHDLVTDTTADPGELARIRDAGVRVHLVDAR